MPEDNQLDANQDYERRDPPLADLDEEARIDEMAYKRARRQREHALRYASLGIEDGGSRYPLHLIQIGAYANCADGQGCEITAGYTEDNGLYVAIIEEDKGFSPKNIQRMWIVSEKAVELARFILSAHETSQRWSRDREDESR